MAICSWSHTNISILSLNERGLKSEPKISCPFPLPKPLPVPKIVVCLLLEGFSYSYHWQVLCVGILIDPIGTKRTE